MRRSAATRRALVAAAGALAVSVLVTSCFGSDDRDSDGDLSGGPPAARPGSGEPVQPPDQSGLGDPYYPEDGNGGYDVVRYDIKLAYSPDDTSINATTRVTATATEQLKVFNLDLAGLTVDKVTIGGVEAAQQREGEHELVITPATPIGRGTSFVTSVTYHGVPGSEGGDIISGWFDATNPGGGFIAGEPHSCAFWYPCNDHPTDKAKFALTATVPRPFSVVSNGAEGRVTAARLPGGVHARTFRWRLDEDTATYLTTVYIDRLTFERSRLPDGTPVISAYGPKPGGAPRREAKLPEILQMLADHWGPYPAPQAGGIFVSGDIPFSLETYTRPVYTQGADVNTIVHENGHQWWGDNVSIKQWRDICFNECLASYSQWLWLEYNGADLDALYDKWMSDDPDFMDFPLYDMGAGNEFVFDGVYLKGSYFVHALRKFIGDGPFFAAMQEIQAEYAGGNMSMNEWRDVLAKKTGTDLDSFWEQWVLETGMPSEANLYPGDLAPLAD